MKKSLLGILYWIVQLTWGAIMTIPGLLITAFCILFLHGKVHRNGYSYIVEIGGDWGGLELGAVALCGNYSSINRHWFEFTRRHEFGHSVQNMILGPLYPILILLPSSIRYWYFILTPYKHHQDYDYAIFEYTASKWGHAWVNYIENTNFAYTYVRTYTYK